MHFNLLNVALLASGIFSVTEVSGSALVAGVVALGVCGYCRYGINRERQERLDESDREAMRDQRYKKNQTPNMRLYPKLAKECKEYPLGPVELNQFRVNCPFPDGDSPLIKAVKGRDLEAALTLIHEHADMQATDEKGRTALHHAAGQDDLLMFEVLVSFGAKLDALDKNGMCPILYAAELGDDDFVGFALATYRSRLSGAHMQKIKEVFSRPRHFMGYSEVVDLEEFISLYRLAPDQIKNVSGAPAKPEEPYVGVD